MFLIAILFQVALSEGVVGGVRVHVPVQSGKEEGRMQ